MRLLSLVSVLFLIFGVLLSQTSAIRPPPLGGFVSADVHRSDVIEAARFAMASRLDTNDPIEIISAYTQVVAGINYKLVLQVPLKNSEPMTRVQVFVYRDLDGNYKLNDMQIINP